MTNNLINIKINNQNGTIVIPKKIRQTLHISDSVILEIRDNELIIRPVVSSLDSVFGSVKPLTTKYSDQQIKEIIRKEKSQKLVQEF
jgi:AbrB family looped-hinge helix DNA binding protein